MEDVARPLLDLKPTTEEVAFCMIHLVGLDGKSDFLNFPNPYSLLRKWSRPRDSRSLWANESRDRWPNARLLHASDRRENVLASASGYNEVGEGYEGMGCTWITIQSTAHFRESLVTNRRSKSSFGCLTSIMQTSQSHTSSKCSKEPQISVVLLSVISYHLLSAIIIVYVSSNTSLYQHWIKFCSVQRITDYIKYFLIISLTSTSLGIWRWSPSTAKKWSLPLSCNFFSPILSSVYRSVWFIGKIVSMSPSL